MWVWWNCAFFCCLLREERQRSYTLQPRISTKKGLAIALATATIASPPLATRSNPHGFYERTKNVRLGQCVFTLSGALGLSPSYGEVWGRLFYLEVPSEMGAPCTHHRRMIAWTA